MKNFRKQEINPGEPGYYPFDDDSVCPSSSNGERLGWSCTRTAGHEPPHAAHTSDGQQQATWEDDIEDSELSDALSDLKKANEETASLRRRAANIVDSIQSARKLVDDNLQSIRSDLSRLPNLVCELDSEFPIERQLEIQGLENSLKIIISAWNTFEHQLSNHMHQTQTSDVLKLNEV